MKPKKSTNSDTGVMEKLVSLAKRRGFVYPGSEIYGGLANSWDYGPLGAQLKMNIKNLWWSIFVNKREDMFGVDTALLMNPKVWDASGHLKKFTDPLSECAKCKNRFRPDTLKSPRECPLCGGKLSEPKQFNMMLKTFLGPVEDEKGLTYFRPETAQGMFVNFKNVIDSFHPKLPFGIAQIGKAFRNEITPGNFIFRTREFEQMEIEYFVEEKEWKKYFEYWTREMHSWLALIGISESNIRIKEISESDRAHYSKRTIDIEYAFPFGTEELYGLAYRGDFDLKSHSEKSGIDLSYTDASGNKFIPHVIEPTFGVDRTLLAVLLESYREEQINGDVRVYLKLPALLAPVRVAVFPLLANKPELVKKARGVFEALLEEFPSAFDDIGNIGKRYRRQDEIGTPFCATIDFETMEDDTVTLRDRDTMKQKRVPIKELSSAITRAF